MTHIKRCKGCTRPVCQRILTFDCKDKPPEDILGIPLNEPKMHELHL